MNWYAALQLFPLSMQASIQRVSVLLPIVPMYDETMSHSSHPQCPRAVAYIQLPERLSRLPLPTVFQTQGIFLFRQRSHLGAPPGVIFLEQGFLNRAHSSHGSPLPFLTLSLRCWYGLATGCTDGGFDIEGWGGGARPCGTFCGWDKPMRPSSSLSDCSDWTGDIPDPSSSSSTFNCSDSSSGIPDPPSSSSTSDCSTSSSDNSYPPSSCTASDYSAWTSYIPSASDSESESLFVKVCHLASYLRPV
jgi:hypothetical protein